jgi:hypothetical protein
MNGSGGSANGHTAFTPGLPTVGVRVGLGDRIDVGARVADFSSLAADAKLNFLRGRLDMAIDPGLQGYYYDLSGLTTPIAAVNLHLPLLLGLNFDEDTTLVLVPGLVATLATATAAGSGASTPQIAALSQGVGARLGLGLNIRASDKLSWQPEVTVWHEFNDVDSWVYVLGIGLNVGAQPNYSELAEPAPQ